MINLNEVFPPALAPARNRNLVLSPSEKMGVGNILSNIDNNKQYTWQEAIRDLAPLMRQYNNADSPKGKGVNMEYLPLELIQISYYIVYKYNVHQNDFLAKLKTHGINKCKKFFDMEVHIKDYKQCVEYKQPKMHINYQGQKKGILAEAIKHLVFQAGVYDCFIDVFGGSGAASLAVPRRTQAIYIFNDMDYGMICLYDTIADDKAYKRLIYYISILKKDLSGECVFPLLDIVGTTFAEQIRIYASKKQKLSRKEKNFIDLAKKYTVNNHCDDYNELQHQFRFYGWYCYFSNILVDSDKHSLIQQGITDVSGKDIEDKTVLALAEIYMWSFLTHGTKGLSSILRMLLSVEEIYQYKEECDDWSKFLDKDYATPIRTIHRLIRKNYKKVDRCEKSQKQEQKTITESMDYSDVIDNYSVNGGAKCKHKKPLFYSDYPYLGTSGYTINNDNPWTGEQSRDLIDRLINCGGKFIFSCRACITTGKKSIADIKELNQGIYDNVLDYFRKTKKPLWVARFSTKDRSFVDALKENKTTEVMITNYELQDFTHKSSGVIEIMSYKDFMKDIDKYLIR